MAVFPEGMNRLDLNDTKGSLSRLESYINYMGERIEFSMRNVTRNVGEAGISNVEVVQQLMKLTGELSALTSTVQNNMNTVQEEITALTERVDALETGNGG